MIRILNIFVAVEAAGRRNFSHSAYLNSKKETHYEVLNLSNDCSKQDIRNAFVKLSKQYHPDVTKGAENVDRTARFLKITEAYQTLVKPSTRREYDDSLLWSPPPGTRETIQPWEVKPTYNPDPGPYYGIRGLNRVSNTKIALFLMALGIIGAIFGFSSVKHSFQSSRQAADEISAEAHSHHAAVVADAKKYGNEEQMRRMVDRLARDPLAKVAAK